MSDLINSTCRCKILFADLIVVIDAIAVDEVDVEIDVDIVFMLLLLTVLVMRFMLNKEVSLQSK